ncbi:MAG: glycosyltransferase involved in cell wall biosynthesis [Neolewinella sp.]
MHTQDGNFVRRFAELLSLHHQVTVLHVTPDPELHGWTVECVQSKEAYGSLLTAYYAGDGARVQRLVNRSRAWTAVRRAYRGTPDLIHAHVLIDGGIVAMRMARQLGVPFVVSCHSSRYLEGETWRDRPLDYWLARRAAGRANALLPVSTALANALHAAGMEARFKVIPNLVDRIHFTPPDQRPPQQGFRLLHLSDFSRQKRLDILLVAFNLAWQKNSTLHLTIAGNGNPTLVKELLIRYPEAATAITLEGELSREAVAQRMGEHDLFVLASEVETQGIVLTEALCCGLPVVTTNCGGPTDLGLSAEDGTIVPVNDPRALAAAILEWANAGTASLSERQERHLRYVERGTPLQIQQQLDEIYQEALAAVKPRR